MDQPNVWNNTLNPVESLWSNYSCVNASGHSARSLDGWNVGQSSSSANPQEESSNDDMEIEQSYFHSGPDTSLLEERQFESSNSFLPDSSLRGNQFIFQSSGSSHTDDMEIDLNNGYDVNYGSALGGGGLSCYRNSFECTSAQAFLEQMNPRPGVGMREAATNNVFSSSNVFRIAENSQRIFDTRLNPDHQETGPFNLPSSGNHGRHSSRQISLNDFLDSINSNNPSHQPHLMHVPWNGSMNSRVGSSSSSGSGNSSINGVVPSNSRNSLGPTSSSHSFSMQIQQQVSEIRQVLNAMRRGGVHDRHRDMRLDVDNMSYEELLALEERIGDVKTGLSEETIMKTMPQRKHKSFILFPPANLDPCCVCQEEYVAGDVIGTLDCGHDFHTDCIKQWLTRKNLCPICKMTGLNT